MALDRNIFSIPNNERSIDSFKTRLVQGGARPNLFEVEMAFPDDVRPPELIDKTDYSCLLYTSPSPRDS